MATIRDSLKRVITAQVRQIFGVQQSLVFGAVLFYAALSALQVHISLSFLMVPRRPAG